MTVDGSLEPAPACNDGSPASAAPSVADEMDGEQQQTPSRSRFLCLATSYLLPAVDKSEAREDDGSLTGQFTWIIENFNKLKQPKLYSPVFQSAQYNWCPLHGLGERPGGWQVVPT